MMEDPMSIRGGLVLLLLTLCACKPPEESHAIAIIGAVLIDGAGGPPMTNSVVLVAEGRIRQAGPQGEIPVGAETAKIDGGGRYLVPGFVDVYERVDPAASFQAPGPANPDEAHAQVARIAASRPALLHIWAAGIKPPVLQALFEAARDAHISVAGHPTTQAEAQQLVDLGASLLIGMIRDTEALDPAFVTRLRDLRIVYAPALAAIPTGDLERARHNTARLFATGVPLAVASGGSDFLRECELMAEAGVPPLDVIVAATANGARVLGQADRGTIQPGKRADLVLLHANPGEDIRNLRRVDRRMVNGEWK